jgi:membrane protein CcdC involved in cytochrome C biogenesis
VGSHFHLTIATLLTTLLGATAVIAWRIRETRTPLSAKKIVIPPLGMSTGFAMFVMPAFRIPWAWAGGAFVAGLAIFSYPLLRSTRLWRDGDVIMLQRSKAFLAILLALVAVRLALRGYVEDVLSPQQTAGVFFVLAFGMILRWRVAMWREFRRLANSPPRGTRASAR